MSVFGVILVRVQSECSKIRTRITPNTDTFWAAMKKHFHWRYVQGVYRSLNSWEYTGNRKSILGKSLDKFWYLDSLEKFVVVVAALADGCSFPELQSSTFLLLFQFVNWQHCMIKWVFFVETNKLWCALNHKRGLFKHVKSFVADLEMCVDHNYFMCDNDYRCPTFVIKDKWTASFLEVGKYEPLLYRDS